MPVLVNKPRWSVIAAAGDLPGTLRLGRTARITAHLFGWPLLIKVGLLSGFALAAAVQHLIAA